MALERFDEISNLINTNQIKIGMTREEMFAVLGKPEETGSTTRKYKVPSVYKYGDVEFVFPPAKNIFESVGQGLEYVYVDDVKIQEPLYLLGLSKVDDHATLF